MSSQTVGFEDGSFRVREGAWEAIVVPWRKVDGVKVTTNSIVEEALGITPFIFGWCVQGYYVARSIESDPAQLVRHLDSIDWRRVAQVTSDFEIGAPGHRGTTRWDGRTLYLVSARRFEILLEQCFKNTPSEKFEKAVQWIIGWCNDRPIREGSHALYADGIHVL